MCTISRNSFGEIGDQRLTVMAGIMVMDELAELQKRVKGMEGEIGTLRKTRDDALLKADKNDAALTGALGALAERMETLATKLDAAEGRLSGSESLEQHVQARRRFGRGAWPDWLTRFGQLGRPARWRSDGVEHGVAACRR